MFDSVGHNNNLEGPLFDCWYVMSKSKNVHNKIKLEFSLFLHNLWNTI